MLLPPLNIDIKERICQAAHVYGVHQTKKSALSGQRSTSRQFSTLNFTLAKVDREWRRVALKYAWHTVYVDDCMTEGALETTRMAYGRYTRKLCVQIKFKGIASHYRRYSQTHENADFQPFCDLHLWLNLRELEIVYAHKCAFPGLAKYLEPRLGNIGVLTIKGRVPIDMRRSAMFLKSGRLLEVNFRSLPREDDSISTISDLNDPILAHQVSNTITSLSLSTLIDVRIVRSVLASTRLQLRRLELIGLNPFQLAAVGLSHLGQDVHRLPEQRTSWSNLARLSIRLCTHLEDGATARLNLDADEFPQLACLRLADCSPSIAATEHVLRFSYEQTFTKEWPSLCCLRVLTLGDRDAQMLAKSAPCLYSLRVQSVRVPSPHCLSSVRGLWHLLASPLPLRLIAFSCLPAPELYTEDEQGMNCGDPDKDFWSLRKNHPAQVISAPHMEMTDSQVQALRQMCKRLSQLTTKPKGTMELGNVSGDSKEPHLYSAAYRSLVRIASLWAAT